MNPGFAEVFNIILIFEAEIVWIIWLKFYC